MRKYLFFLMVFVCGIFYSQHKFLNVPELTDADIQSQKSIKDPEAAAEVLYRSIHYRIDLDGFLYQDVIDRVKIYNKDNASKFLDHEIATYDNGKGDREMLKSFKASTINFENGKKVVTKVERDEKYKSKENKNYFITKFAFPNVKNGSVVEYSYQIYTPFLGSTPRVLIEDEIPVRYVEYVFETPVQLGYTLNYKGDVTPTHRETGPKNMYGAEYQVYRLGYENVPAFKEEKYVLNNDNYKTGIKSEINSTNFNNQFKSYAVNWNDIRKRLYENDNFGEELKKQNMVKDILPADIKSISNKFDRASAVLKFVQRNYSWNKEDDVVTDKGVRNLVNNKIGNSAEINLLLILLLRSAEIPAEPIVLSTVKRGMLLAYNPSIAQLNFVIASYLDGDKLFLFDGSNKLSEINMISPKALNYYGLMMTKTDVKQVNIFYPEVSQTFLNVDAKMNPDGTFEGKFSDKDTKLYAMMVNESYMEDKEKYSKTYKDEYKFPISDLKHTLADNNDFESSFNFTSDTFVDAIGSKLVFNPLLFLYTQNHNFDQKETRRSPLEFYSACNRSKKVTISIPENYAFENVPKSKKFRTDDNALKYSYVVTQEGNKLTVESKVEINDAVFPKEYYPAFKQIYDNITKQEAQVVTAVKK